MTTDPLDQITANLDTLPTRDLEALRKRIEDLLKTRWWVQHGQHPAVIKALALFDGNREATYAWMTTPHA